MGGGWDFGGIDDVGIPLCVCLFLPSSLCLLTRKLGWRIFGIHWLRGLGGWNPCFSRALNDWEVEEAERFLERLHGKRVLGDVDYMVVWTETKSGKFSTKSLYLALEADYPYLFPSSCIWNVWNNPILVSLRGRLHGVKH
ncbi:hypothetical protein CK203_007126 [Vitis vinifera]|uniref:Uncharacterized protein n=1 Tax=Vitis vinifera TaxID=29760 RepID=A0A438KC98_VITVI|nr:hypothetical protein CK203_007126 [Vitis vinifera]